MIKYIFTIFLGSFLLFLVQPMIAKFILPWFGGGAAVWNVSLIFFQTVLLGGYLYGHLATSFLNKKKQFYLHISILIISLLFLPIIPSLGWKPVNAGNPTLKILGLLLVTIGIPYLVLSTTSPLIQVWFSKEFEGKSPYRLYALSNIAALSSLFLYPVLIEPHITLKNQAYLWSALYAIYVLLTGFTIYKYSRLKEIKKEEFIDKIEKGLKPNFKKHLRWIVFAMSGTIMLMAVTNQATQDIPPVPFLWVLFLAIYLISFILTFESDRWYNRKIFVPLFIVVLILGSLTKLSGPRLDLSFQIFIYSLTLFVSTMVAHGELSSSKPAPGYLTRFYLMISIGGALGGFFTAIVAPIIFTRYIEFYIGLGIILILLVYPLLKKPKQKVYKRGGSIILRILFGAFSIILLMGLVFLSFMKNKRVIVESRNFYGVLSVKTDNLEKGEILILSHGRIVHGTQLKNEKYKHIPLTYYGYKSGIGLLLKNKKEIFGRNLKIAAVGLGVGSVAAYGTPNDFIRFYEINPAVLKYANRYFTYLKDCRSQIDVVLGDARIQMENEIKKGRKHFYDVIIIDAFSGDSVPMHLITIEAMKIYLKLLKKDGVLAFHTSNNELKIEVLVYNMAKKLNLTPLRIKSGHERHMGILKSYWVLVSNNKNLQKVKAVKKGKIPWSKNIKQVIWTDNYGSLLQILK
jgi:hypothetical protein